MNLDFVPGLISSYVKQIEANFKPTVQNADGGLYVGAPGVAFMFLKLSASARFQEKRKEFLETALNYIKVFNIFTEIAQDNWIIRKHDAVQPQIL